MSSIITNAAVLCLGFCSECLIMSCASRHSACDTTAGDDDAQSLEFRIIDYGHARLAKNKALAKLPKAPGLELSYRK